MVGLLEAGSLREGLLEVSCFLFLYELQHLIISQLGSRIGLGCCHSFCCGVSRMSPFPAGV